VEISFNNRSYDPLDGNLHPEDIEAHVKRKKISEILGEVSNNQETGGGIDANIRSTGKDRI